VRRTVRILDVISTVLGPQNAPKSLAAGALPRTPMGKLTALLQTRPPIAGFEGVYF